MITREFEQRTYDCFLSYGSEDREIAERMWEFLKASGLKVFFDERRFTAGNIVVEGLAEAIAQSKSCIVLLSQRSIQKSYVKHEIQCAGRQAVECNGAFRFIAALLEDFDPSTQVTFMGNFSWLKFPAGELTVALARQTLLSVRRGESVAKDGQPQIYVSCSWRDHEQHPRDLILRRYAAKGAFLVGDSRDQGTYREQGMQRIRRIMSTCSGCLVIYPRRADPAKSPEENYKYFPDELSLARELDLPVKGYCADPAVLPRSLAGPWTTIFGPEPPPELDREIVDFLDDAGAAPPHAFLATDHKRSVDRNEVARDLVEHLLGMNCTLGKEVSGGNIRKRLIDAIRTANIVIADIASAMKSEGNHLEVNVNTCIEAGIAMAANRPLFLTCLEPVPAKDAEGKTKEIPFFFRDHAIEWYKSDLEFVATVHRIARDRRRRILNDELTPQ